MLHIKHNVGPRGQSWAYRLVGGEENGVPRLRWAGPSDVTIDDLVGAANAGNQAPRNEAVEFLRESLEAGPRRAGEIERAANDKGITQRTLSRAKKKLGVKSRQKKREWWWSLPN